MEEWIMDELLVFKIIQLMIIGVFTVFISDLRKKNQSPLICQVDLKALKLVYLFPLGIYFYSVVTMVSLTYFGLLGLVISCLGCLLVVISKKTLGNKHTWAGYCLKENNCFIVKGVYSYIRHPLYTGIFVFSMGGFFLNVLTFMWFLFVIAVFATISILVYIAGKETAYFSDRFGEPFNDYKKQVHPFFPLSKYKQLKR